MGTSACEQKLPPASSSTAEQLARIVEKWSDLVSPSFHLLYSLVPPEPEPHHNSHRAVELKTNYSTPLFQVGAATETELEDRKLRIEDAKNATFAAVEEGIVPGGGAALLHLAQYVPDFMATLTDAEEKMGADILRKSLT